MRRAWLLAIATLCACDLTSDLARMIRQEKAKPYTASRWLPGGQTMQPPPEGTVPRERELHDPAVTAGAIGDQPVDRIPIPVDAPLLARGRERFDIFCAPCHGVLGDGDSEVARRMSLRRPPSLVDLLAAGDRPERYGPGALFRTISEGFGLMPSYRNELLPRDRWAVIAYLRALTLSQRARLDQLPPDVRGRATQEGTP